MFFFGTPYKVTSLYQLGFEGDDPTGMIFTTLRIAARLRGMYIFRCEENSFLVPRDEEFFVKAKGEGT